MLYTGGPRPYGYEGFGELFVFLFFGIVAVAGSFFVQTETLVWEAFALAVPVGLLAAAVLVVNNVRDIDTDRRAGKRTLAVRLGRERTRVLFAAMVYGAFLLAPVTWIFGPLDAVAAAALLVVPLAAPIVRTSERAPTGRRSTRRSRAPVSSSCLLRAAVGRHPAELSGRARAAGDRPPTAAPADPAARPRTGRSPSASCSTC